MKSSGTQYDVIVLGAGASGLFCAITAAQRGRKVLVLEKANKVGKKILMSGGGRCNFTNYSIEPGNFISANPHFCKAALKRYTQWDFIALVDRYNIPYEERKHGQLFCLQSAKNILDMLLSECARYKVDIRSHCDITSVVSAFGADCGEGQRLGVYDVEFTHKGVATKLTSSSVVVATGALSIPTLGGSGFGYELARQFGLNLIERRAGLVPFMFSDNLKAVCERLSGLALDVTMTCRGQAFRENLLFTHRGMSGPVALQISNYWQPGDEIVIDLLPEIDAEEWLLEAKQAQGKMLLKNLLHRYLAKSLVAELQSLWWGGADSKPLAQFGDRQLVDIARHLKQWCIKPSGTEGYRTAEVTLGGVDTDGVSSKTMEAKNHPGLFFIGEVLDVTGHLGGYNFQWAWSSGFSAGLAV